MQLGVAVAKPLAKGDMGIEFGCAYKLDKDTSVKAKVCTLARATDKSGWRLASGSLVAGCESWRRATCSAACGGQPQRAADRDGQGGIAILAARMCPKRAITAVRLLI